MNFKKLSKKELLDKCDELKIKNCKSKNKIELIDLIKDKELKEIETKIENLKINNKEEVTIDNIKPILKWVGGKTQILDILIKKFPLEINNYYEIFLGGGSVLLKLLTYVKKGLIKINEKIYAYDINEPLIYLYKNIQNNYEELFFEINKIISEFNLCDTKITNKKPKNIDEAKLSKENYYYWIRNLYNKLTIDEKKTIKGSSLFLFLNKTCFRGIFRVGPNGFNVPYGNYKNPEIVNKQHLKQINNLIKNVIFECIDFNISLNNNFKKNDFIYLDPPYVPENENSFVGYTLNGFNLENHKKLFSLIHKINNFNIKFMLSNSNVKMVNDNFNNYNILSILCKRTINSKNPNSKTKEVIITNY